MARDLPCTRLCGLTAMSLDDLMAKMFERAGHGRKGAARAVFVLLAILLPSQAAWAADWRYCYAGSDREQRLYLSQPFQTARSLDALERAWEGWLTQQGLPHESTGCPRSSDRPGIEETIQAAIRYNRTVGRSAVELNWRAD